MKNIIGINLIWLLVLFSGTVYAEPALWSEVSLEERRSGQSLLDLMPDRYSLYQLDEAAMRNYLNTVARSSGAEETVKTLSVPLPNREMIQLIVTETSIMAPELASKYPQIKTYKVIVVDRPGVQGVVDINELGFHAMLFLENGKRLFIDPRRSASGAIYYVSYYDSDYILPISKSHVVMWMRQLQYNTVLWRVSSRLVRLYSVVAKISELIV